MSLFVACDLEIFPGGCVVLFAVRMVAAAEGDVDILGLEPEPSRIVHPNVIVVLRHLIGMATAYIECVSYGRNACTHLLILFESCLISTKMTS